MNKMSKIFFRVFLVSLFITAPVLYAGGGDGFAGGMAGGMMGSMLGNAMTQPKSQTVVVQDSGSGTGVSRSEVANLERNLRDEITGLEQIVRNDLNKLYDRIREAEAKIRDLEDKVSITRESTPAEVSSPVSNPAPVAEPIEEIVVE